MFRAPAEIIISFRARTLMVEACVKDQANEVEVEIIHLTIPSLDKCYGIDGLFLIGG